VNPFEVYEIERDRFGVTFGGPLEVGACIRVIREPDSFNDLMTLAQMILDHHYPADIPLVCDRNSPDPGPRLTAALRDCIAASKTNASRSTDA
jgi:hypothetical protein